MHKRSVPIVDARRAWEMKTYGKTTMPTKTTTMATTQAPPPKQSVMVPMPTTMEPITPQQSVSVPMPPAPQELSAGCPFYVGGWGLALGFSASGVLWYMNFTLARKVVSRRGIKITPGVVALSSLPSAMLAVAHLAAYQSSMRKVDEKRAWELERARLQSASAMTSQRPGTGGEHTSDGGEDTGDPWA